MGGDEGWWGVVVRDEKEGRGESGEKRCVFFFFKQKTAYEMLRSLVGSEMCIRDRFRSPLAAG